MDAQRNATEHELSKLLLPASATMIGVCATLIGLVKIMEARTGPSHVDEYAACLMVLFMVVTVLAYLSLRLGRAGRMLEAVADGLFLLGLAGLTAIGALFGWQVI